MCNFYCIGCSYCYEECPYYGKSDDELGTGEPDQY